MSNPEDEKMLPLYHSKDSQARGNYRAHVVKPPNQAELLAQGAKFDVELKEILRKGDVFGFRNFLSKDGRGLPTDMMLDTVKMETMLHQLVLTMPDLADIHQRSRDWLANHTLMKPRGLTLLQASSLTPTQKKHLATAENPDSQDAR